ncbi:MAG: DUF2088 domain-containing protein [Elusimicrobia bacterium]|nr:DUF2088 domain-containing protein [Elusimicrobiota bacterium]
MKKEVCLTYGNQTISGFIPQEAFDNGKFIPLILPKKKPVIKEIKSLLLEALEKPIGSQKPLSQIIKHSYRNGDIAVITDDHDRPNIHTRLILPVLIEILNRKYKIPDEKIRIVIATGIHRASTTEELKRILGKDVFERVGVEIHDCRNNLTEVGKIGEMPIRINSAAFNSDILIPLTDVENHYFTGVAGGPKVFCPGICDIDTITYEHLQMLSPDGFAKNVGLGIIDGNPVFEAKKEIVGKIVEALKENKREIYSIVSIIDTEDDLVYLRGGELFESHRNAAKVLKDIWTVQLRERPDIVIAGASVWGVNFYQMGKATHSAYNAVKKGGIILNVAPCSQGWGNEEYKKFMKMGMDELNKAKNKSAGIKKALELVVNIVKKDFRIGKQKPIDVFQILNFVGWGNLHIIQDGIPKADYGLTPFSFWGNSSQPVKERLNSWLEKYLENKTVTVIDNPGYLLKPQS